MFVVGETTGPSHVIYNYQVFVFDQYGAWMLDADGIYNDYIYSLQLAKLYGEYDGYGTEDNPDYFLIQLCR